MAQEAEDLNETTPDAADVAATTDTHAEAAPAAGQPLDQLPGGAGAADGEAVPDSLADKPGASLPDDASIDAVSDASIDAVSDASIDDGLAGDLGPEVARTVFADLGLSAELLRAVVESGYIHPTPIQEQAIPIVLMGRDVLGCAQTGTGKTASFTLPMMDILAGSRAKARMPRSLILEPTRELALRWPSSS
jgi:ATP-dependent helicase YprA (DUF1998 family)